MGNCLEGGLGPVSPFLCLAPHRSTRQPAMLRLREMGPSGGDIAAWRKASRDDRHQSAFTKMDQ